MLNLAITSQNNFYELGLLSLIQNTFDKEGCENYLFIDSYENKDKFRANVVFKDLMVIINIYQESETIDNCPSSSNKPMMTLNIPFKSNQLDIYNIISKIKKIFVIARLSYFNITKHDAFKQLGLKSNIQLSITESKVVELTGQGHCVTNISKILKRSEKTVLTHRRNASRKLGMLNRLEFYNYASYMKNHSNGETVLVCI
ncbi:helix-turn-helix domain-containing protein [Yersinia sp. LJYL362]|uniref:helix-turn-helix domain-containing protein n=1 Tax=Yersinia sp. LJYL362 TaxID=3402108 RepID=UPI003AB76B2E